MPSLGSLTLPDDPIWVNEFDWTPVEQNSNYSLTGASIVQVSVKQAGRLIRLDCHWLTRAQVQALAALADVAGAEYTLTLHQGTYTVLFDSPPYEIQSVRPIADPDSTERYAVQVNLMTV